MSQTKQVKDYYAILGVSHEATQDRIDQAYNNLAVDHHPKKTEKQGLEAHKKFKDICEAYKVLSNKTRREHYDHLIKGEFTINQALNTFRNFYHQEGILNEEEKQFFNQIDCLNPAKDYYAILGLPHDACMGQIKQAYRKLALKYHPQKNPENQEALQKFIEVNEAYNALSEEKRRNHYHEIAFKNLTASTAHDVFEEFFSDRPFRTSEEEDLLRPLIQSRWIKKLDKLMDSEHHSWPEHENVQTKRVHEVYTNKNGVQTRKIVKQNKKVIDGKVRSEISEEYVLPTGEKQISMTIRNGDQVEKKVYHLKNGEEVPKELENGNQTS